MNTERDILARRKEILLKRSALCRLRLHRRTHDLRASLPWNGALAAAATSPPMRQLAFGLALSLVGLGRATRLVMLAGRVVLFARLARSVIDLVRKPRNRAAALPLPVERAARHQGA
jgi:hypothetical protein